MVETRTIVTVAAGSAAAVCLGYCVYFDHKRRHDAAFRLRLTRENKKLEKVANQDAQRKQQEAVKNLKRKLDAMANEPAIQRTMEDSEAFFMEQVSMGEQLAAQGPAFYVDAAIHFYKALKVYPAQAELINIYEKTQPPEVYQYCMVCLAHELTRNQRQGPVIEEIDEETPATTTKSNPPTGRTNSQTGSESSKTSNTSSPSGYDFVERT